MKGNTLFKRLCLSLLCLLPLIASAAKDNAATVPFKAIQVGVHSYYVQGQSGAASSANQGFMSNAGFVITPAGVVVFDSLGTPPLADLLIAEIRKRTQAPIKRVIVSHYHADHVYGLQPLKAAGAEIWAHEAGKEYLNSDELERRLAQRRDELFPWVDETTKVLPADVWLAGDTDFEMGGVHFAVRYVGPAHTNEDIALFVKEDDVLFAGDVVFKGRVPFVGAADSKAWLAALDKLLAFHAKVMVPGHGAVSRNPKADLTLTRDYLTYLRKSMGNAVAELTAFDEAYAATSWKQFEKLPAFKEANRANAYNTYILMEKEALK
jgi:glyoxylase-like metal-dependent hydrolase (beta-lactamase superfamily II)